jgi:hypothetical protein
MKVPPPPVTATATYTGPSEPFLLFNWFTLSVARGPAVLQVELPIPIEQHYARILDLSNCPLNRKLRRPWSGRIPGCARR